MIRKVAAPNPEQVRIYFELPSCLWADRIYLVGDFNGWDSSATPMQQERDGVWRAIVDLQRGSRHEFRYLVDGQWISDFHADGFAQTSFGASNSVVIAALPAARLKSMESQVQEVQTSRYTSRTPRTAVVTIARTAPLPSAARAHRAGVTEPVGMAA